MGISLLTNSNNVYVLLQVNYKQVENWKYNQYIIRNFKTFNTEVDKISQRQINITFNAAKY